MNISPSLIGNSSSIEAQDLRDQQSREKKQQPKVRMRSEGWKEPPGISILLKNIILRQECD